MGWCSSHSLILFPFPLLSLFFTFSLITSNPSHFWCVDALFHNQMMCGCGGVACTQCGKGEGWGVLWNGQKAGGLSLRVKRDERVGVWWLDGVDVSVMAWCQTLYHCHCLPHQPISQWSATVCFKAIVFVATSISVLVLLCCPTFALFFFTIKIVGLCQSTNWQRASHTISKKRGGDYRAMASCQGVLSEG